MGREREFEHPARSESSDLSIDAVYGSVADQRKPTNFIDYLIPELYVANTNWPLQNWKAARKRSDGGEWRFFVWDAGSSFEREWLDSNGFVEFPATIYGLGGGL